MSQHPILPVQHKGGRNGAVLLKSHGQHRQGPRRNADDGKPHISVTAPDRHAIVQEGLLPLRAVNRRSPGQGRLRVRITKANPANCASSAILKRSNLKLLP